MNKNIQTNENNKYVSNLFPKYYIDNNELLSYEDFNNFYLNSIKKIKLLFFKFHNYNNKKVFFY